MKLRIAGLLVALLLIGAATASAVTVCEFRGSATFSSPLKSKMSTAPIPFGFTGTLFMCEGAKAGFFNAAAVSATGQLDTGASCAQSTFGVSTASITKSSTTISTSCTTSIPDGQGIAAAGVATSVPQPLKCTFTFNSKSTSGTAEADFQLQFLVPPNAATLNKCNGAGVTSLSFTGGLENTF